MPDSNHPGQASPPDTANATPDAATSAPGGLYCPSCSCPVSDPLVCRDCSSVICRDCGTPLESADELSFG